MPLLPGPVSSPRMTWAPPACSPTEVTPVLPRAFLRPSWRVTLHRMVKHLALPTVLLALGLVATGCTFSREWKAAARQPADPKDITGAWEGTWQNSNNDHQDRLKAVVTRVSDTEYRARFKAWWHVVFSGTFRTTLKGSWQGDVFVFEGQEKVYGWRFDQEGRVTSTQFDSKYLSDGDDGSFTLRRPVPRP